LKGFVSDEPANRPFFFTPWALRQLVILAQQPRRITNQTEHPVFIEDATTPGVSRQIEGRLV
jgi:hypothetical protein